MIKRKSSHVVGDLSNRGQERREALIKEAAKPKPKASELEYVAGHEYIPPSATN